MPRKSCTLLLFEVLREFVMEKVNMNVVGGDGENGLPEKMTCMEDSMAAGKKHDVFREMIVVRPVAVLRLG